MLGGQLTDVAIPYDIVGIALVGMVVVGVLAAAWPARRAARTDVLAAIATE
jgi:putative ABC transport system permease protein